MPVKIIARILPIFFLFFSISCGQKNEEEFYVGKLDELIVGSFKLEKDSTTKYIDNIRTLPEDDQVIYIQQALPRYRGTAVKFFNLNSQKNAHQIIIPNEGPESLKGGGGGHIFAKNPHEIILISHLGLVGKYDREGKKLLETKTDFSLPASRSDFIMMEARKGLMYMEGDWIQIGQNPSNSVKYFDPKERLARSEFPLLFSTWLSQINVKTGETRHSNFKIPGGYEVFKNDMTSTYLMGAFHPSNRNYFLAWPYSDTIYRLKDLELIEKIKPKTSRTLKYLASDVIPWGTNSTVWELPKEAAAHIFLIFDLNTGYFVRLTKTHESGPGPHSFERTKHYLLSVYRENWDLIAEYDFEFEGERNVENWFLNSNGLFINKSYQPNEDEYEFFQLDLSKIKKP
jgi:hypothetical protein